jgi:hypothetical protein
MANEISKSTQAKIGIAVMVLVAGLAILMPTILKMRAGILDEDAAPGLPLNVLNAIVRADPAVASCGAAAPVPSGLVLVVTLDGAGGGRLDGLEGAATSEQLRACMTAAVSALRFPEGEDMAMTYRSPFVF